jgi:hypothetical protein
VNKWTKFFFYAVVPGGSLVALWYFTRPLRSSLGYTSGPDMPWGIQINNPGNIESDPANAWLGKTGEESKTVDGVVHTHDVFDTPVDGLRAIGIILAHYGDPTLAGMAATWVGNPSAAAGYAKDVASGAGLPVDASVDLTDPAQMTAMTKGIVKAENGVGDWYTDDVYNQAAQAAISQVTA